MVTSQNSNIMAGNIATNTFYPSSSYNNERDGQNVSKLLSDNQLANQNI